MVRGRSAPLKPALAAGETSYFGLFHLSSRELLGRKVRVGTDLCRMRVVMEKKPFHSMHMSPIVLFLHAAFCKYFPILRAGGVAWLCGPQCLFCITAAGEVRQPSVSV